MPEIFHLKQWLIKLFLSLVLLILDLLQLIEGHILLNILSNIVLAKWLCEKRLT